MQSASTQETCKALFNGFYATSHHTYSNQIAELDAITEPNQVWCSDLSRIEYHKAVWYLATIEDVATRQIIAHQIGKYHNSQLVLSLLK